MRSTAESVSGISSGSQSTVCDGPSRGQADAPCRAGMKASTRSALSSVKRMIGRRKAEPQHALAADTAGEPHDLLAQQGAGNLAQRRLVEIDQARDVGGHGVALESFI